MCIRLSAPDIVHQLVYMYLCSWSIILSAEFEVLCWDVVQQVKKGMGAASAAAAAVVHRNKRRRRAAAAENTAV